MKKPKSRMGEVLDLARQGKSMECANKAVEAFDVYTKRISKAIGQYPAQDGAFIVAGLRHIANSIEANSKIGAVENKIKPELTF